jgi:acetyl esterase
MMTTLEPLGSLPEADAQALDEIGPAWGQAVERHRDRVMQAYTPLLQRAPRDGLAAVRDIPYGSHPRQVLDVHTNARFAGAGPRDVLVFIHGGAFVRGAKSVNGLIYDNVPVWFSRQGCIGVNVEYRLAPEARYPAGAEDLALAIDWLQANIAGFGGDPARIFLLGHSAGGTHVATLLFDPLLRARPQRAVTGAILVSARLELDGLPGNPNAHGVKGYFGEDPTAWPRMAPASHPDGSDVPLMIVTAQYDNPYLDLYGTRFCAAVAQVRGTLPRYIQMRRHNHTSTVAHFDSGEEYLGREVLAFMATAQPADVPRPAA